MRKKIRLFITLTLLALVMAGGYAWFLFRQAPQSLLKRNAEISCSAEELSAAFMMDEQEAGTKYTGRIVEITGKIFRHYPAENLLTLGDSNSTALINCALATDINPMPDHLQPGTTVVIRGICTGFLADVQLNQAVFIINTTP